MDLFEDSAQLVKILLEEGMQPLESPRAAGQELGEGRSRRAAGLGQDSSTTGAAGGSRSGSSGCAGQCRKGNNHCSTGTFHPEGRQSAGRRAQPWAWGCALSRRAEISFTISVLSWLRNYSLENSVEEKPY